MNFHECEKMSFNLFWGQALEWIWQFEECRDMQRLWRSCKKIKKQTVPPVVTAGAQTVQGQSQRLPLAQHVLVVFDVFHQRTHCHYGQNSAGGSQVSQVLVPLVPFLKPFQLPGTISAEFSLEICFWKAWHGCQCYLLAPPHLGLQLHMVHVCLAWVCLWILQVSHSAHASHHA